MKKTSNVVCISRFIFVTTIIFLFIGCGTKNDTKTTPRSGTPSVHEKEQPQSEEEYRKSEIAGYRAKLDENIQYIEKELVKGTFYSDPIESSIRNLSGAKDPKAIPILLKILKECPVAHARKDAAEAIGWIGDAAGIPILKETLGDKDYQVKTAAAEALVRLGAYEAAFPTLKKIALKENMNDWELDVDFILNVGQDEKASVEKETEYIQRMKNRVLPHKAVMALSNIGDDRSIEIIKKIYENAGTDMRIDAGTLLLGTKYKSRVLPEMMKIARDDKIGDLDRIRAITGMVYRNTKDIRPLLEELKNGPNKYISRRVEKFLRDMDKD